MKLPNAGGCEQHRPAVQSGGQKSPSGAFLDARLAQSTRAHPTAPVCKYTGAVLFLSAHGAAACSTSSQLRKTAYDQRNGAERRIQKPCKRSVLRKSCTFIEIFFKNRLTKPRRDGKIYRQSAVAVKIESGRVPEWPMGTDCKSAAFQLRWFESTRAHQELQCYNDTGVSVLSGSL